MDFLGREVGAENINWRQSFDTGVNNAIFTFVGGEIFNHVTPHIRIPGNIFGSPRSGELAGSLFQRYGLTASRTLGRVVGNNAVNFFNQNQTLLRKE
ncbi:MAG: hypothetical protein FWC20_12435 [Oscillospiraceae bacterium]|nr:hypothetical protein [Oscillospiraceae bacterium]MCL2280193.1 hypothetical protein [Oscillospiraceae bacterium]